MTKRGRKKRSQSAGGLVLLFIAILAFLRYPLLILSIISLVIAYFIIRWKKGAERRKRFLESGIQQVDVMEGTEFEEFLKALFSELGFKVELTAVTGDFGADLILKTDDRRIVVQAKRYSKTVGVEAVQQAFASKPYYRATEAWVVTNNTFTRSAHELAKKGDVSLIGREKLIKLMTRDQKAISSL